MSVEVLRRAADVVRDSWAEPAREAAISLARGEQVGTMAPTMLAVADWLDWIAECRTVMDGIAERVRARGLEPQGPGKPTQVFLDMETHALAVATAYLGVTP